MDKFAWWAQEQIPESRSKRAQAQLFESLAFQKALSKVFSDAKERVVRAEQQWNLIIREAIRTETGLRLVSKEKTLTVAIKVEDGYPDSFADFVNKISDDYWIFLLQLKPLENALNTIDLISSNVVPFLSGRQTDSTKSIVTETSQKSILETIRLLDGVITLLKECKIEEMLKSIDEDILGAYFFAAPRPEIHLYWMPIAAMASIMGVSIEALTVVVLTHELAHAYTHIGFDIDSAQWKTKEFQTTNLEILEGLAQFYTEVICTKNLSSRILRALDAYNTLLNFQNPIYHAQTQWAQNSPRRGEAIRNAMIKTRVENIKKHGVFLDLITNYVK